MPSRIDLFPPPAAPGDATTWRALALALCGALVAPTADAAILRYANDPEPMVMRGEPGPYTARIVKTGSAGREEIELVRRPARISFARLGDEQCLDKMAGPVPCDTASPQALDQPDPGQEIFAALVPWGSLTSGLTGGSGPGSAASVNSIFPIRPPGFPGGDLAGGGGSTPTDPSPVPLPGSGWLLLAGLAGLFVRRRS